MIRYVPETPASKIFTLIKEWKVYKVSVTISNEKRKAPEGIFVLGGGIETVAIISFMDQLIINT